MLAAKAKFFNLFRSWLIRNSSIFMSEVVGPTVTPFKGRSPPLVAEVGVDELQYHGLSNITYLPETTDVL